MNIDAFCSRPTAFTASRNDAGHFALQRLDGPPQPLNVLSRCGAAVRAHLGHSFASNRVRSIRRGLTGNSP